MSVQTKNLSEVVGFNRYMVECEYGIGRDVVVYQLKF